MHLKRVESLLSSPQRNRLFYRGRQLHSSLFCKPINAEEVEVFGVVKDE
jgi:hypothetical protein